MARGAGLVRRSVNDMRAMGRRFNFVVTWFGAAGEDGGPYTPRSMELIDWKEPDRELLVKYMAWGNEVCPTTEKEHAQMFICFKAKTDWDKAKEIIQKWMPTAHVEPMVGSLKQNELYCSKAGDYTEWGEKPKQGARLDIKKYTDQIRSGETTVNKILEAEPEVVQRMGKVLVMTEAQVMRRKYRTWMTEGIWYWGPTGCGKSHKAYETFLELGPDKCYMWSEDSGWWDQLTPDHECIIIDEFRGEIKFNLLLRILDKWPLYLKGRYGAGCSLMAKKVIITSALPPERVYANMTDQEDRIDQLLRRLTVVDMTPPADRVAPIFRPRSFMERIDSVGSTVPGVDDI